MQNQARPLQYDYITIGIITRNEEKTLPLTLWFLLKQSYPLDHCEIIIADGNSNDNTQQVADNILSQSGISYKILNERNFLDKKGVGYGHSRWRNVILMNADKKSKYIARIDADCRADKNRLLNLWSTIQDNSDPMIAAVWWTRFVETQGNDISDKELILNYYFTSNIVSLGNPAFTPKDNIKYIWSVAGYSSLFKKEIFEIYQYDSTFPFNTDDLELNFRLKRNWYKFLYSKNAKIYHRGEKSISWFLRQMKNYGKGVAYTMRIHTTPRVRLYAWISLGYIGYTLLLPLRLYICHISQYSLILPFVPYSILWMVWICIFIENYKKTHILTSFIVIPTLFAHLRVYGSGVIEWLLEKKKRSWKQ